jgi:hypothetical protein
MEYEISSYSCIFLYQTDLMKIIILCDSLKDRPMNSYLQVLVLLRDHFEFQPSELLVTKCFIILPYD